MTGASLL